MESLTFVENLLTNTVLVGILGFVLKTWLEKRLQFSIQHEYEKRILHLKNQHEVRLRAELVADLMAEWIKDKGSPDYHRLNQLSFQAFLWLPAPLARDLSSTLAHTPGADDLRTILQKIRKHLLGESDDLSAATVNVFTKPADALLGVEVQSDPNIHLDLQEMVSRTQSASAQSGI